MDSPSRPCATFSRCRRSSSAGFSMQAHPPAPPCVSLARSLTRSPWSVTSSRPSGTTRLPRIVPQRDGGQFHERPRLHRRPQPRSLLSGVLPPRNFQPALGGDAEPPGRDLAALYFESRRARRVLARHRDEGHDMRLNVQVRVPVRNRLDGAAKQARSHCAIRDNCSPAGSLPSAHSSAKAGMRQPAEPPPPRLQARFGGGCLRVCSVWLRTRVPPRQAMGRCVSSVSGVSGVPHALRGLRACPPGLCAI